METSILEAITVARSELPLVVAQFLAGRHKASARPAGIFTPEDIIRIKLYVKRAQSLPRGEASVVQYIGYNKIGIEGLEPADINVLFERVHDHASQWSSLENMLKKQSIDLDIAAREIATTGSAIIDTINKMPIMERLETLGQFSEKSIENLSYSDVDGTIARDVGKILAGMKEDVKRYRDRTASVKQRISDFKTELTGGSLSSGVNVPGLEPAIKSKRDLLRRAGLDSEIKSLREKIDRTEDRIEELKRDYDKYVGLCFTGAAVGIVPFLVTGGIFGAKAEEARKARNALLEEVERFRQQMGQKNNLQQAIEDLAHLFIDVGFRMLDAESALGNLEAVWEQFLSEIEASERHFAMINEADSLLVFTSDFTKVIQPWSTIEGLSLSLIEAINAGLAEYKRLYEN